MRSSIAALCAFLLIACSDAVKPQHSAADYRAAKLYNIRTTVYQDTYDGDDVASVEGKLRFPDGTVGVDIITLTFEGGLENPSGYCVFSIDDIRALGDLNTHRFLKKCNGSDTEAFKLGSTELFIKGELTHDNVGLAQLHITDLRGGTNVSYFSGHAPSENSGNDSSSE